MLHNFIREELPMNDLFTREMEKEGDINGNPTAKSQEIDLFAIAQCDWNAF